MRAYLVLIRREAKKRFDAGMSAEQAARDVKLGIYARWREPERILPKWVAPNGYGTRVRQRRWRGHAAMVKTNTAWTGPSFGDMAAPA